MNDFEKAEMQLKLHVARMTDAQIVRSLQDVRLHLNQTGETNGHIKTTRLYLLNEFETRYGVDKLDVLMQCLDNIYEAREFATGMIDGWLI